ncbi:MAG: hypothetical protein U0T77_09355 [Chitinophagales bacterium]
MRKVKQKQEDLIDNLRKNGFKITQLSKSPLLFSINDKAVNLKTKLNFNSNKHGREFWFGVYKSILKKYEYTLIQMVDKNSFLFINSKFLLDNWNNFYSKNDSNTYRTFMIEWDSLNLVANKRLDINSYYCNLEEKTGIIFNL